MKKFRLAEKLRIVFWGAVLFTGLVLLAMYNNMRHASSESANVRSSLNVVMHLDNILTRLQAAESGTRTYARSGDTSFLSVNKTILNSLGSDVEVTKEMSHGNADSNEIGSMLSLISAKILADKKFIEEQQVNGSNIANIRSLNGRGAILTDSIVNLLNIAKGKQRAYLQEANNEREHYARRLSRLYIALAAFFCICLVLGFIFIMRDFRRSEKINRTLLYNSTLLRNISDPIITCDTNYLITDWNIHAEELYGFTAEEAKGKNVFDLLGVEFYTDRDAGQQPDSWRGEVFHRAKNGKTLHVELSASALRNEENKVVGSITVVRDISERAKLEQNLMQLTEDLQKRVDLKARELNLFYDRIADAFIALDNDWNYTYANKAALAFHGKERAELMGKNIWEVFPDVVKEPFYQALHQAKETQSPQRVELYYSKSDSWYEDLIYPGEDGISVYYRDITKKKKAIEQLQASEEALKFSNERFELVARATNDAIWDWDMRSDRLSGNMSFNRLFGIAEGTSVNYAQLVEKIHPDDRARVKENFKNTLKQRGSLLTEEFRFVAPDGSYRSVYNRAYILYNRNNRGYRMLGAIQDITAVKEAQQKLVLEKELSDSIINSLPGIFYLFNKNGEFYLWNKNFETVSGYPGQLIADMHPLDFFVEGEKELLIEKIKNVFISGSDNVEALYLTRSGVTIPYYFTGTLINYENEECMMGVGIDISEKVRSQQELINNEEKFRMLIQQASDGIIITDETGRLINVNEAVEKITGYSETELQGMNIYSLFYDSDGMSLPFRYNEMMKGITILTERVIKRKDGRMLNVEVSFKQMPDGLFQGIIRDITERKLVEEALRNSEKKYRVLFNENPLPMWIIALQGKTFLDVNTAALLSYGYSKEEFLALDPADLNHAGGVVQTEYEDGGAMRYSITLDHQKKDGTVIKVNIISHDIVYEGTPAVLVLAHDITAKFEAEENLQRSHEELRELASHVETVREAERTHMAREIHDELGQQLTGLKMDISWLAKKINSVDEAINDKIKATIGLIDKTVITVRRIATELRPSILDDLGLVAAMEWQSEEFEKRSDIRSVFSSNVSHVTVNPDMATGIFRIFQESLTNVLRHSKATEVISSLWYEHDILTLMIEDNGVGFNEQEILNKKTLGLLGMKERALLINGTYEINGNPGKGTNVRITVPLDAV